MVTSVAPGTIGDRAAKARAAFDADGLNISAWARERGFAPKLVHQVLSGNRACRRGQSHQVAMALGIKGGASA